MAYAYSIAFHIATGSLAVLLYWVALLSRKGKKLHRLAGKSFFSVMFVVALSIGPMLFLRPGDFDPAHVVQFVYLGLCLVTVSTIGWTSIRWKHDLARFRGLHFRLLGPVILLLGLVVLGAGIANGRLLTVIFSWVGLVYGSAMIRFAWMQAKPHAKWWLGWHLNGVAGLFNAAHGTFLAVSWRALFDPSSGDGFAITMQLATISVGAGLRLWFGQKHGVPLVFSGVRPTQTPRHHAW